MNRQVKKYEDVGPYPYFGGKPMPPGALHGGLIFFPDIISISALAYRDLPVEGFIEVCWSTE